LLDDGFAEADAVERVVLVDFEGEGARRGARRCEGVRCAMCYEGAPWVDAAFEAAVLEDFVRGVAHVGAVEVVVEVVLVVDVEVVVVGAVVVMAVVVTVGVGA
jgi:hypothetical protein